MRSRPLLVRPGTRFTCHGDGLCCSDAHALGPITRSERRSLPVWAATWDAALDDYVLATEDGACVFYKNHSCSIHVTDGPRVKPLGCHRFPLGLVATPSGGRVTTQHRCSCRTLGTREELTAENAEPWLVNLGGRLDIDDRVGATLLWRKGERISFARYEERERVILEALEAPVSISKALGAEPFPRVAGLTWTQIGHMFRGEHGPTKWQEALAWFGEGILFATGDTKRPLRPRPWSETFDRAMKRSKKQRDPAEMLSDWVADQIWALAWRDYGSFEVARKTLSTRAAVAEAITTMLVRAGARPDRAMAEGLMIIELSDDTTVWWQVLRGLKASKPSASRDAAPLAG